MRIAVTAPAGNVGTFVVRNLVRAGIRPLLLSRRAEASDPRLAGCVDVAVVDLVDRDAVLAATKGVDALYAVVPSALVEDPLARYDRIGRNLADAVAENGISRTVFQSSGAAELRHGAGEIDGLAIVETMLDEVAAETEQAVAHLRCGFFFTNLLLQLDALRSGTVPILWPTDHAMPWVAPRDIAEVGTALLLRSDWSGRRVQAVHGPADLTWDEAMAVVSEAVGREVRAQRIPDDDMRAALRSAGLAAGAVEAMVGMAIGLREGYTPEQRRDATTTTETALAAWAYEVLRPLLAPAPATRP